MLTCGGAFRPPQPWETHHVMTSTEMERTLRRVEAFSDLGAGELRSLAGSATVVEFPAASLILREGGPGDGAYVVVRGSVQVFTIDHTGYEIVLARLHEGAQF